MNQIVYPFTDWTSVWVALLAILFLIGLGFLELRQAWNPQKPAQQNQNPAGNPQASVSQKHPTEEEHRSAQQAYWDRHIESQNRRDWVGWLTLAFSALATVGVILSFRETRRQADIAGASYIASTRAWFDVDVDLAEMSLKWKEGAGVVMYAKVKGTNNGNSPAMEATVNAVLATDKGMLDGFPKDVVRNSCVGWVPANGGDMVFMKEPIEHIGPASLPWYEIKAVLNKPKMFGNIEQPTNTVMLYLVACAMYKIVGDDGWHHTARIFRVVRIDDPDAERFSTFLNVGEDLETERLILVREDIGAYAD